MIYYVYRPELIPVSSACRTLFHTASDRPANVASNLRVSGSAAETQKPFPALLICVQSLS